MYQYAGLVQFPKPSPLALALIAVAIVATIVGFWSYERMRRREREKNRLQIEWKSVRNIIEDRRLSKEEAAFLNSFLKKHAPAHPLHAVSTREGFEACVEKEMSALAKNDNDVQTAEMGTKLRDLREALRLDHVPVGQRITTTRELHPNQWVYTTQPDGPGKVWHRMMVEQVDEANFYMSTDKAKPPPPYKDGQHVRCRLWRDEDGRYIFETTMHHDDEIPGRWRLPHAHDLKRTQSRAHFRVRHDQSAWIGIVNAPPNFKPEEIRARTPVGKLRGKITSLSAGGCAVVVPQAVSKLVVLRISLELPGEKEMKLDTKIVASSAISGDRYLVRGHFIGISDENRDAIAKHVLRRQQYKIAIEQSPED